MDADVLEVSRKIKEIRARNESQGVSSWLEKRRKREKEEREKKNLNELCCVDADSGFSDFEVNNVSVKEIGVYFRDLENHLIRHIYQASYVFGAVAWLTSEKILDAMAKTRYGAQIVVQKEDFLRPDLYQHWDNTEWKKHLRKKYDSIKNSMYRFSFEGLISHLSVACDPEMSSVRCVGNYNSDKKPAFPRMHNKFLLFAHITSEGNAWGGTVKPYAVWTGSFNFTKNATYSLENALYIVNEQIVDAYFKEYSQILALSEPLDWEHEWVEPEYRIGT